MDSSTKVLSLAVSDKERILKVNHTPLEGFLSSTIIPSIKKILKDSKVKLEELDGFAVGLGPGSFTSLRVGLATIKGLAFAAQKPIVGISSLDVLAMALAQDGTICALTDARRNMVYAGIYEKKTGKLKQKGAYLLTPLADFFDHLKKESNVFFVGDAVELFKEQIQKHRKDFKVSDSKMHYPQAEFLVPLTLEKFKTKKFEGNEKIVPLYLYAQDCQVQK